ncbi:transmembrane protein 130-like [Apostichopus japonicus]|uniref:transmembrane protein 130-like n=1 Tax=Stichopus japonicus TaxID=307972 RepID=UPI003AB8D952
MRVIILIPVFFGSFLSSTSDDVSQLQPIGASSHSALPFNVTVTCDGPTTLGGTTSCLASLYSWKLNNSRPSSREYTYLYWDSSQKYLVPRLKIEEGGQNSTHEETYLMKNDIGAHTMIVEVKYFATLVARGQTSYNVTEDINIQVLMSQNETVCHQDCYAATNKTLRLIASIHDPSDFFQGSIFLLDWDFGDGNQSLKTTSISVSHIYSTIGTFSVSVSLTAIMKSGRTRSGMSTLTVTTLDAIQNLTADGVDGVIVGEERQINISCYGSPPIAFCWSIYEDNTTSGLPVAESCLQSYWVDQCRLQIDHQFNSSCGYVLSVRASNDVSFEALAVRVDPKAPPDVSKPSVAGVVVGVLFGLTLTCICMAVVIQQIRNSRKRNVEVANFNFNSFPMHDPIREHARRLNDAANVQNERTPLLGNKPSLEVRWVKGQETVTI